MLAISRSSIYLLIDSGQLNPIRIGRSVRLPVDQLEQFIADRRMAPEEYPRTSSKGRPEIACETKPQPAE